MEESREGLRPLAERMRPSSFDDFYGQEHLVMRNSLLRRAINVDKLGSAIFYGPPGTGKTTLAYIISKMTERPYRQLNAVLSGIADAKKIIDEATHTFKTTGKKTLLVLDECHRWSKTQSDSLLSPIERGVIVFVGTTTENPYVNLTRALISRCRVFEFKKLTTAEIIKALNTSLSHPNGLKDYHIEIDARALEHIASFSDGDLRTAFNALELAVLSTYPDSIGKIFIDIDAASQSIQKKALSLDENAFYDMLSAFCKSLRGSDSDAALYWSERMIQAGVDPLIIARRLVVHSAEDVGMADPMALNISMTALNSIEKIGLPECRLPLAEAIIYVCEAPKSNSVCQALDIAKHYATEHKDDNVPTHLLDTSFMVNKKTGYKYPHDYGGYVKQDYLPQSIKDIKIYKPSKNGYEANLIREKFKNKK